MPWLTQQLWQSLQSARTHKRLFLCTYSHVNLGKQNFGLKCQDAFVFWSQRREDVILALSTVQYSSVFPVMPSTFPSKLSSPKSPWQRTCLYPFLCQNWHYKKHLLPGCEQCWQLKTQQTDVKVVLFNTLWPPAACFLSFTLEKLFISLFIISRPCIHIVKIIIFCTWFCYKLGHKNEKQWPGFEFKEIITILFSCHVFFVFYLQGFLDLRFALYYLVWCQQNRGRGWQWSGVLQKTEGCASRIRESEKQRKVGVSLA